MKSDFCVKKEEIKTVFAGLIDEYIDINLFIGNYG